MISFSETNFTVHFLNIISPVLAGMIMSFLEEHETHWKGVSWKVFMRKVQNFLNFENRSVITKIMGIYICQPEPYFVECSAKGKHKKASKNASKLEYLFLGFGTTYVL